MWLCEGKLKVKLPHFRLPSASQNARAYLISAHSPRKIAGWIIVVSEHFAVNKRAHRK